MGKKKVGALPSLSQRRQARFQVDKVESEQSAERAFQPNNHELLEWVSVLSQSSDVLKARLNLVLAPGGRVDGGRVSYIRRICRIPHGTRAGPATELRS